MKFHGNHIDPCSTCSDRWKLEDEEPCCDCGPPDWVYHDENCEDMIPTMKNQSRINIDGAPKHVIQ